MKAIIAELKLKIAVAKEDIQHDKSYIELLRSRRPEAKKSGEIDMLEDIIEDRRETLRIREELLSNLRYSLMYAIRALGYNQTDIDAFEPEKFILK